MSSEGSTVELIASGSNWVGYGARSVDSAIRDLIRGAREELHLGIYSATPGGMPVLDLLEPRVKLGIRLTAVINRASDLAQPAVIRRLKSLSTNFRHAYVYSFEPKSRLCNLHAKVAVGDRMNGIIGSSNLSRRGLIENYEMGVRVSGALAHQAADLIDRLARGPECVPIESINTK